MTARRVRRLIGRLVGRRATPASLTLPEHGARGSAIAVCHPDWRGVRTAAYAFRDPLVETADPAYHVDAIVGAAGSAGASTLVVHAFPPGTDSLLAAAKQAGLSTRAVVHSSFAQHGAEAWEAAVVDELVELHRAGVIDAIGFVKAGMAEVFRGLGVDARHTPNRAPRIAPFERLALEGKPAIGVFAAPFWRKNVVTQVAAVSLIEGATAHVMERPPVQYLADVPMVEHGTRPWEEFTALQGSVDLNLYVTLSECHPMSPMESYLAGVPCLMSRTSALFRNEPDLWEMVTVSEADDPVAIAAAARRLLDSGTAVVDQAREWIETADARAALSWAEFTGGADR